MGDELDARQAKHGVTYRFSETEPLVMPSACYACGTDCAPATLEQREFETTNYYAAGAGTETVTNRVTLGLPICAGCLDRTVTARGEWDAFEERRKRLKERRKSLKDSGDPPPEGRVSGLSGGLISVILLASLGAAVFVGWLWDRALGRSTLGAVLWAIVVGLVGLVILGLLQTSSEKRQEKRLSPEELRARQETPQAKLKEEEEALREDETRLLIAMRGAGAVEARYDPRRKGGALRLHFANQAFAEKLKAANSAKVIRTLT
jgi:hypothetical protein